jgi:hypothetical protein
MDPKTKQKVLRLLTNLEPQNHYLVANNQKRFTSVTVFANVVQFGWCAAFSARTSRHTMPST